MPAKKPALITTGMDLWANLTLDLPTRFLALDQKWMGSIMKISSFMYKKLDFNNLGSGLHPIWMRRELPLQICFVRISFRFF
jgi:hypothetical protein